MTHTPRGISILLLDDIPALFGHPRTREVTQTFIGKEFMCTFPNGQLYFESKLSLDADGSPAYAPQDPMGQLVTATKLPDGSSLDADIINYFVLPGGFYTHHGIRKGDIAVVIYGLYTAFACFGDVGPAHSLGEGSIALHRDLGNETISGRDTSTGGRLMNRGIDRGAITIVFPGSGSGFGRTNKESAAVGLIHFQRLKQEATAYKRQLSQSIEGLRNMFLPRLLR